MANSSTRRTISSPAATRTDGERRSTFSSNGTWSLPDWSSRATARTSQVHPRARRTMARRPVTVVASTAAAPAPRPLSTRLRCVPPLPILREFVNRTPSPLSKPHAARFDPPAECQSPGMGTGSGPRGGGRDGEGGGEVVVVVDDSGGGSDRSGGGFAGGGAVDDGD